MALNEWKKLVAEPVTAVLKGRGFRKKGFNFSALRPGVKLLVSLQSSKWSTKGSLEITCNLAIRVDQLACTPGYGVWTAHWYERVGYFRIELTDYWWICTHDDDARKAGFEIAGILEDKVLPLMETLATPAALAQLWSSGQSPGLTEFQRNKLLSQLLANAVTVMTPQSPHST